MSATGDDAIRPRPPAIIPGVAPSLPIDTATEDALERYYSASQWQLAWQKFRRHRLAVVAAWILVAFYLVAAFADVISPYGPNTRFSGFTNAPPQMVRVVDAAGNLQSPFVYPLERPTGRDRLFKPFVENAEVIQPLQFFVKGEPYKLFGLIPGDIHLVGVPEGTLFLFGADSLGRDIFSRTIHGSKISLTIGLVGVFISFVLGLVLGGLSGYFGGWIDTVVQRTIDLLISIPTIPLWMALAASIPSTMPPEQTYLLIVVILSITGWTTLARVVRGQFLSLRDEDYVLAARLAGIPPMKIIFRHLVPGFASYIIVYLTLAIPNMILGETALSFLGLGLQPPAVSWGVMLSDAQQVIHIAKHPWVLFPAIFVVVVVLMFNFLGDGLRDAADPYS